MLHTAKSYFREIVKPALGPVLDHCAIGMFGHGSQVLGYDDEVSQDHDYGIQILILVEDIDPDSVNKYLTPCKQNKNYRDVIVYWDDRMPVERSGVAELDDWLLRNIGITRSPTDSLLLTITDQQMLWLTNGELWYDAKGTLSSLRKRFDYWPDEIWRSKICDQCLLTILNGPYQLHRSLQRGDEVTHWLFRSRFVQSLVQMLHLVNRRYCPIPKWQMRSLSGLNENCGVNNEWIKKFLSDATPEDAVDLANSACENLAVHVAQQSGQAISGTSLFELYFKFCESLPSSVSETSFWQRNRPS